MKKLAVTLLGLTILAIAVIIAGIYVSNSVWKVTPDTTGAALKQVFNDAEFQQVLSQESRSYRVISEKTIDSSSNKGFINYSGRLTGVLIDVENPMKIAPYHFHFIVDADRKRTLDKTSWLDLPSDQIVTILPGVAWYDRVQAFGDMANTIHLWGEKTPKNASIYMLIVKQEGLDILRNSSGQVPLQDIDISRYSYAYNSTVLEINGQPLIVDLPPTDKSTEVKSLAGPNIAGSPDSAYFVVVINGGNTDINATINGLPLLHY